MLAVAAGLIRPDRGEITLDGRPLTATGGSGRHAWVAPHDREIALLAQDPLLFPHLSVLDNVEFAPRARGVARSQAHATARHWLDQVGVAELADRKPSQVSGGQAQRVAVARALAADPRLLLLDEPMAALDVAVTPALRQTLRSVLAERSVILVTHDALDALLLADTVIVLDRGRIVEQGPAAEVLTRPRSAFAARIAGLNILHGTWHGDRVQTVDGATIQGMVDGAGPRDGDAASRCSRPRRSRCSGSRRAAARATCSPRASPRSSPTVTASASAPQGSAPTSPPRPSPSWTWSRAPTSPSA